MSIISKETYIKMMNATWKDRVDESGRREKWYIEQRQKLNFVWRRFKKT